MNVPLELRNVGEHPDTIRPRLSHRIVLLERNASARYELARLVVTHPQVLIVTRAWQLVSRHLRGATRTAQVTDPSLIAQWEASGRLSLRFQLVLYRHDDDRDLPAFPEDGQPDAPIPHDRPEGWIQVPMLFPWGDSSSRRIPVGPNRSARLFCDVRQEGGLLASVGGLLEGESRLAIDSPAFWHWWTVR